VFSIRNETRYRVDSESGADFGKMFVHYV